ncbi:hypothetical protein PPACK8108_LOCUS26380 [Phakopsora pachyrhizi]|uniref:Uncharacterized protein n=1 Tax=Phakopsora pachyrhizi TaxID=170000 RepID=A0AAV0BXJ6_PHAPC|nr:hypothetical protein PPACK8108_LOCUS26380 [Phakopsora pachyrhizi]
MSSWSSWLLGQGLSSGTQQDKVQETIAELRQHLIKLEKKEDHLNKKIDDELKKAKANATTNKRAATAAQRQKKLYEQELDCLAVNATMESIREQMDLTNKISNAILNPDGMGQELDEDETCKEVWTKDKTGADDDNDSGGDNDEDDENENGVYEAFAPSKLHFDFSHKQQVKIKEICNDWIQKNHKLASKELKLSEARRSPNPIPIREQTAFLCWVPGRSQDIEQDVVFLSKYALVATWLVLGLEEKITGWIALESDKDKDIN